MLLSVLFCFCLAAASSACEVSFEVKAPAGTPATATVFITGSDAALGSWNPGKIKMRDIGGGEWFYKSDFPEGKILARSVRGTQSRKARGAQR